MMQADDFVGRAAYLFDEEEFIAAHEAAAAAAVVPGYGGWLMWIARVAFPHYLILVGASIVRTSLAGNFDGSYSRFRAVSVGLLGSAIAIAGATAAYHWVYGRRRILRRRFLRSPLRGLRMSLVFARSRLSIRSSKADLNLEWPLYSAVAEFRDGFLLLRLDRSGDWIPRHALAPPFDAAAAVEFLRGVVPEHRLYDRCVRPSGSAAPAAVETVETQPPPTPGDVVGRASYALTEDDFVALARAVAMANFPWLRRKAVRILAVVAMHALLAIGAGLAIAGSRNVWGAPEADRRTFGAGMTLMALTAVLLWFTVYGRRSFLRSRFQAEPLAGEEISFGLTTGRFVSHTRLVDSSLDWSFLDSVLELRDGFVLKPWGQTGGHWIPDRALQPPFDHAAAAAFLRSRVANYHIIDFDAGPGA